MNVDCNECGASLTVGDATRFATCVKCKTRLAIKRSDTVVFSEKLSDGAAAAEADAQSSRPSDRVSLAAGGDGESILRIAVGALLLGSDIFWFMTNPGMQSLYVRLALLAAGAWLVLSGIYRLVRSRAA